MADRHQAALEPGQVHDRPLEALGGVERGDARPRRRGRRPRRPQRGREPRRRSRRRRPLGSIGQVLAGRGARARRGWRTPLEPRRRRRLVVAVGRRRASMLDAGRVGHAVGRRPPDASAAPPSPRAGRGTGRRPARGTGSGRARSASSSSSAWALVRTSTAWCDHGTPGPWRSRTARAMRVRLAPVGGVASGSPGDRPVGAGGLQAEAARRRSAEHRVGDREDLGRRAVVVVERDDLGAGEAVGELGEEARRRRRSRRRSPGSGRRRRTGRARSPRHASSSRNCSGLTSWNSSTNRWRNRQRWAAANSASRSRASAHRRQQVVEVDQAAPCASRPRSARRCAAIVGGPSGGRRPAAAASAAYRGGRDHPGLGPLDLAGDVGGRDRRPLPRGSEPGEQPDLALEQRRAARCRGRPSGAASWA